MTLKIQITQTQNPKQLPDFSTLEFGKNFTDHMFQMTYTKADGWHDAKIVPFADFQLSPATLVMHYAQEIFEGLKAYHRVDGEIGLFRPLENFKRMNRSAERICMPSFDENFALEALHKLIEIDKRWVPDTPGASMYIRPTMIGIDAVIGLRPSDSYLFYIIMSPVGAYFKSSDNKGLKILVESKYVRAVAGGIGEAKTGANYAASLLAGVEAYKKGYSQVLWLDGAKRRYIEEVGTMNIFFVRDGVVVTPKLNGSILPGITRKSVIELLSFWKKPVKEESLDIGEILEGITNGSVTECFGAGTAAVISPVGSLHYEGKTYALGNEEPGPITQEVFAALTDIQYAKTLDNFHWTETI